VQWGCYNSSLPFLIWRHRFFYDEWYVNAPHIAGANVTHDKLKPVPPRAKL
jgi:hypothetical protein